MMARGGAAADGPPANSSGVGAWASASFREAARTNLAKACLLLSLEEEAAAAASYAEAEGLTGDSEGALRGSVGSASTWSLDRITSLAEECAVAFYAKLQVRRGGGWRHARSSSWAGAGAGAGAGVGAPPPASATPAPALAPLALPCPALPACLHPGPGCRRRRAVGGAGAARLHAAHSAPGPGQALPHPAHHGGPTRAGRAGGWGRERGGGCRAMPAPGR